ncbi:hypothetical protein ACSBR1_005988 [Camellia fascicularis]
MMTQIPQVLISDSLILSTPMEFKGLILMCQELNLLSEVELFGQELDLDVTQPLLEKFDQVVRCFRCIFYGDLWDLACKDLFFVKTNQKVPQAFCAVFQLYLREYAEEDQLVGAWDGIYWLVGAWDGIHWTKNPGIRSYFDEKQPSGKFGILWDFDVGVIAMGSSSSWQTAPSKSIYEDSIKSFDEAIVPQFGAFFTPKL